MSLTLTTQEIKPAVSTTHEKIVKFTANIEAKELIITTKFGTDVLGVFTPLVPQPEHSPYVIQDTPEIITTENGLESLTVTGGIVTLAQTPSANLAVLNGATPMLEGVNYSISGNVITSIDIAESTVLDITYEYTNTIPADNAFTDIVTPMADNTKSLYDNVKGAIYNKLIAQGKMSGTVI